MSEGKSEGIRKAIKTFIHHVESLENSDKDGFGREYELIQEAQMRNHRDSVCSMDVGKLENNLKKNRYKDIVPYDDHRIVLSVLDGDHSSDYINASRIVGVRGTGDYIASQGPLSGTVNDFWRMIWEYNVEIIIMACRLVEMKKIKCTQYWPGVGMSAEFGNITVFTESEEEIMTDCIRRTLRATKGKEVHYLSQFHYCGWPDHGIPENLGDIRDTISTMRQIRQNSNAPLLIHCSAGCGRTGAIIAIDYVWTLLEHGMFDETFSLFDLICNLREQRMSLVQTPDQYALVNKVLKTLCEEWLAKMASHTYENVQFIQEHSSVGDSQKTSEEHDYEDIWSLDAGSPVKATVLNPKECSTTEEKYLGRSEEPEYTLQSPERETDDASSVYANVAEIQRKIQGDGTLHQEEPSGPVNNEMAGHKTVIIIGTNSSTKKAQVPAVDTKEMHAHSSHSYIESSDLKGGSPIVATMHAHDTNLHDISPPTSTTSSTHSVINSTPGHNSTSSANQSEYTLAPSTSSNNSLSPSPSDNAATDKSSKQSHESFLPQDLITRL